MDKKEQIQYMDLQALVKKLSIEVTDLKKNVGVDHKM